MVGLDDQRETVDTSDANQATPCLSALAASVPKLAAETNPAAAPIRSRRVDLGTFADQALRPGRDAVAAQEADPGEHLPHLDHERDAEEDQPPRVGEDEEAGDRESEDHN